MTDTRMVEPMGGKGMNPKFAKDLLAAQLDVPSLEKSKTVDTGKFKYDYCPLSSMLAAIRPAFAGHGIAIVFRTWLDDMTTVIACTLIHAESGETLEAILPLPLPNDEKQSGSMITYRKRYALGLVTGITAEEDDDGTVATEGRREVDRRPATAPAPGGGNGSTSGKKKALRFIEGALKEHFGGEKPWDPVVKAQVLKDVFGSGKWTDVRDLDEHVLANALRTELHPALNGVSRFETTMRLVEDGKRRPDDCDAHNWPQKLAAGASHTKAEPASDDPDNPFAQYGPEGE